MDTNDFIDLEPAPSDFRRALREGFETSPKSIPPKFLYDERGSELFEDICELEEYYPTRTELGIMEQYVGEMADEIGPRARIVEFGSGSGQKTQLLLEHLEDPAAYLPIEISRTALRRCAEEIDARFPDLGVTPIVADYTEPIELPEPAPDTGRTVGYFPGSTLGNFQPPDAIDFLTRIRKMCAPDGGLLVGVDLDKSPDVLEQAYDDSRGVTAAFNRNVLRRANRELDTDFDLEAFEHRAVYDTEKARVEMQLVSTRDQTVHLDDTTFEFSEGEKIVTEHSHKFTRERFERYADEAGLESARLWIDPDELFSVWYLRVA